MPMNEWELTADVASWINEIIGKDRTLPFSRAKCEQRPETSLKRRDLTLLGGIGQVLVTGEIKLPYQKDGSSPYNAVVVNDARAKAFKASSKYFFTWNVNECVLWGLRIFGTPRPFSDGIQPGNAVWLRGQVHALFSILTHSDRKIWTLLRRKQYGYKTSPIVCFNDPYPHRC